MTAIAAIGNTTVGDATSGFRARHARPAGDAPARLAAAELGGLVAVVAFVSAFMAWWWWAYRDGMPLFIDEAGYLSFAVDHSRALQDGGLGAFFRSLHDQGPYGPLVPGVTALALTVVDRPLAVGAATMVGSVALLIVATWFLARRLCPWPWALLAAAVAGTLPGVLALSGVYYFAVPAAALFTLAVGCLVRGEGGVRLGWMAAAGVALGLAALARTMMVGLVPAAGAAALAAALWPGPRRGRRLVGVALAGVVGVAVALTWYAGNAGRVVDYLHTGQAATGAGGGGQAWQVPGMRDLRVLMSDLLLPAALVLLAAAAVAAVTRHRAPGGATGAEREAEREAERGAGGDRRTGMPALALPVAIVALGAVLLVAARQAYGQWTPLLPTLVVVVVAVVSVAPAARVRTIAAAALCALAAFHLVEASRLVAPLSTPRSVAAGPFGRLYVTDARWLLEDRVPDELDAGGRLPDRFAATGAVLDAVVASAAELAGQSGEPPVLVMPDGTDALVNPNAVRFASELRDAEPALVVGEVALDPDVTPAELGAVLDDPDHGLPNLVLTVRPDRRYERSLAVYEAVTADLPGEGFAPVLDERLPDDRPVTLWWRPRSATP